jgi:hypothetical protein
VTIDNDGQRAARVDRRRVADAETLDDAADGTVEWAAPAIGRGIQQAGPVGDRLGGAQFGFEQHAALVIDQRE